MRKNLDCLDNINTCIAPAAVLYFKVKVNRKNTEASFKVDRSEGLLAFYSHPVELGGLEQTRECW